MLVVLDASVILKWFRTEGEEKIAAARNFEEKHLEGKEQIAVPELLFYEVANVLLTKPKIKTEEVEKALEILSLLDLKRYTNTPALQKIALEICQINKISFYDASYVALAQLLKTKLVTADQKLYQKLKSKSLALL